MLGEGDHLVPAVTQHPQSGPLTDKITPTSQDVAAAPSQSTLPVPSAVTVPGQNQTARPKSQVGCELHSLDT
jgi:hypothetical protein